MISILVTVAILNPGGLIVMSNFLFVLFSEFPTSGETPLNNGVSAVAIKNAISLLLGSYSSKRWLENQPGPELNFGRCFQKKGRP